MALLLVAGCGLDIGSLRGTQAATALLEITPELQSACSEFSDAMIAELIVKAEASADLGFTEAENLLVTEAACSDHCGNDAACDVPCFICTTAILDHYYP